MIPVPNGMRVWLATGHADMRKGFPGLALLVQETLKRDPFDGDLFIFRGRRGDLIKIVWHDGQGACLSHCENTLFISVLTGLQLSDDVSGKPSFFTPSSLNPEELTQMIGNISI